jgi:hypothetical protein
MGESGFQRAERGRYLAAKVGLCIDCHSSWRMGSDQPLDPATIFVGGRGLSAREWGVPPPRPDLIFSRNITPHDTGIAGWTAQQVQALLKQGTDDEGKPICRPMPSGPMGGYANLTDDDALDIGVYLSTLSPVDSGQIPECKRKTM